MKNIKNKLLILFIVSLAFTQFGSSQDNSDFELEYEVNRVYPYISITRTDLNSATSLIDLNPRHFKPSWVKEYYVVEIVTTQNGKIQKAVGKNNLLTQKQKDNMKTADVNTDIIVNINYLPNNTLKNNEPKKMDFTFSIEPDNEATFASGEKDLKKYLEENVMAKISKENFKIYNLTALKFTVNETGEIVDTHIFQTSDDTEIDNLFLEVISNMPKWKPAKYYNGIKVKQEFTFTVGDHRSCVINTLSIRRLNN